MSYPRMPTKASGGFFTAPRRRGSGSSQRRLAPRGRGVVLPRYLTALRNSDMSSPAWLAMLWRVLGASESCRETVPRRGPLTTRTWDPLCCATSNPRRSSAFTARAPEMSRGSFTSRLRLDLRQNASALLEVLLRPRSALPPPPSH